MEEKTIRTHRLYRKGDILTFNISPGLTRQRIGEEYQSRKASFIDDTVKLLKELTGFKYQLWMEISKNGLLHWHGTLKVLDAEYTANSIAILMYKHKDIRIEIDSIEDKDKWHKYCTKDAGLMKTMITDRTRVKRNIMDYMGLSHKLSKEGSPSVHDIN